MPHQISPSEPASCGSPIRRPPFRCDAIPPATRGPSGDESATPGRPFGKAKACLGLNTALHSWGEVRNVKAFDEVIVQVGVFEQGGC